MQAGLDDAYEMEMYRSFIEGFRPEACKDSFADGLSVKEMWQKITSENL